MLTYCSVMSVGQVMVTPVGKTQILMAIQTARCPAWTTTSAANRSEAIALTQSFYLFPPSPCVR